MSKKNEIYTLKELVFCAIGSGVIVAVCDYIDGKKQETIVKESLISSAMSVALWAVYAAIEKVANYFFE